MTSADYFDSLTLDVTTTKLEVEIAQKNERIKWGYFLLSSSYKKYQFFILFQDMDEEKFHVFLYMPTFYKMLPFLRELESVYTATLNTVETLKVELEECRSGYAQKCAELEQEKLRIRPRERRCFTSKVVIFRFLFHVNVSVSGYIFWAFTDFRPVSLRH